MCILSTDQRVLIENILKRFLSSEDPFTGYELAVLLPFLARREVSSYVREMFNKGEMPGWASTQVIPKKGPVLYFKIHRSSKAAKKAKIIRTKMESKDSGQDGKEAEKRV